MTTLEQIQSIYAASDGDATRLLYASLEELGSAGIIAVNLLRASKCSERAKAYRKGRGYKTAAYERKDWSIHNLAGALFVDDLGLRWGWAVDGALLNRGDPHHHIIYVEMPTGQVSFHLGVRYAGPDFAGEWDGVKDAASDRIIRWAAQLFDNPRAAVSAHHQETLP
jgi:hypothetical protein